MSKSSRLKQLDRMPMVPRQPEHAFTLIDLLVVLAIVTLLAMTLLPALARTKYPPMVSNCTANYKQWVQMANVYASDDPAGGMPSLKTSYSAGNPTDVATNFLSNLVPYGMTVAMNFCPVRQADLDGANQWVYWNCSPAKRPLTTIAQLNQWFTSTRPASSNPVYPAGRSLNGGYAKLLHDLWVPRPNNGTLFPVPGATTAPAGALPWPLKTSDKSVSQQPIISDIAEGDGTSDISKVPNNEAHFYNGALHSVNLGFADGHVDTHNRASIGWQFTGNGGKQSYFY